MLKIGYDAKRAFHNWSGLGNYSRDLIMSMARYHPENKYYLYDARPGRNERTEALFSHRSLTQRSSKALFPAWWRQWGIRKMIADDQLDVFHGLSHEIPTFAKKRPATVVSMHDLIYKRYPAHFGYMQSGIYDLKYRSSCLRADHIVAISESTRRDLIKFYKIEPSKISVIYQSCHEIFRGDQQAQRTDKMESLPGEFLLFVGALTARKNLLNLLKAIAMMPRTSIPVLIIVGTGDAYEAKVRKFIHANRMENRVIFFGQASLDELHYLYQHSLLLVYPSLWEGFGIPVIEALYSKTPVVTSNISSMPEAAGQGAFYVDPHDPESIANGIRKVLGDSDLREKLIRDGYQYVQRFDPRLISDQWNSLYKCLIG